jgi:flagellar biosynthesis/type III secretory pathway protein FliH
MTDTKYKRRTFKEVASAAHAKGYAEGREQGRKEVWKDYDAVLETNLELARSVMALEGKLDNISLRKLAWSRITGLFKRSDYA